MTARRARRQMHRLLVARLVPLSALTAQPAHAAPSALSSSPESHIQPRETEVLDQDLTCPLPPPPLQWQGAEEQQLFRVQRRAEIIAAFHLRGWDEVCSPRATQRCPRDDPDGGIPSVEGNAPLPQWQRKGKGLEFNLGELPAVSVQINTHTGTV